MSSCRGRLSPRRSRFLCRLSSRNRRQGPWTPSEDLVGEVPLPEHALLPALDIRDRVRQDLEGVVRRDDGHAQHVAEGNEHEEVLEIHARAERRRYVAMRRHPLEDAFGGVFHLPAPPLRLRWVVRFGHLASPPPMRTGLKSLVGAPNPPACRRRPPRAPEPDAPPCCCGSCGTTGPPWTSRRRRARRQPRRTPR